MFSLTFAPHLSTIFKTRQNKIDTGNLILDKCYENSSGTHLDPFYLPMEKIGRRYEMTQLLESLFICSPVFYLGRQKRLNSYSVGYL